MIKMIAFLVREKDLTHEEFVEHYNERHHHFGASLPHVARYSTAVPLESPGRIQHGVGGGTEAMEMTLTEYDGISTFHFESYDDYLKMIDSEEFERALEDEDALISDVYFVMVEETVRHGGDPRPLPDDIE
jgi:hypothetical protein